MNQWDDLVAEGIAAREGLEGLQWKLGDLALTVETVHGQHTLEKYAAQIGVEYDNLRDYRRVAAAFEIGDRSPISWNHHRIVVPLNNPLEWLKKAEAGGWSRRELVRQVEDSLAPPKAPHDLAGQVLARMESGEDPGEIVTDVIQTYGPLSPRLAKEVARHTHYNIPATDNIVYDELPAEVHERDAALGHRQISLIRSLRQLGRDQAAPEIEVAEMREYLEDQITENLEAAVDWLVDFRKLWRERHCIK